MILKDFERCKDGFVYYLKPKNSKEVNEVIFTPFPEDKNFKSADDYWEFDIEITKCIKEIYPDKEIVRMIPAMPFCSCKYGAFGTWDLPVKILEIEEIKE